MVAFYAIGVDLLGVLGGNAPREEIQCVRLTQKNLDAPGKKAIKITFTKT
jgi:hypothetical protein